MTSVRRHHLVGTAVIIENKIYFQYPCWLQYMSYFPRLQLRSVRNELNVITLYHATEYWLTFNTKTILPLSRAGIEAGMPFKLITKNLLLIIISRWNEKTIIAHISWVRLPQKQPQVSRFSKTFRMMKVVSVNVEQ